MALFVSSNRDGEFPRLMTVLDGLLGGGRSLMAGPWDPGWSRADCALTAYLAYLPIFFADIDLSPWPAVQATIAATQARPAHQRALGSC